MIRLVIYAVIFATGLWAGAQYEEVRAQERCLNAGGAFDARGFCLAPQP